MSVSTQTYRGFGGGGTVDARVRRGYAAYTGLPQPPVGYEYETCASLTFTGFSLQQGSSPAVVIGDVFAAQSVTMPSGYATQINNDGTMEIFTGSDSSRQSFLYKVYRVANNAFDGPATVWVNEIGPVWGVGVSLLNAPISVAITPINLAGIPYAVSPEGDTLSFVLSSGSLPPGVSLSGSGVLSGTPTALGNYNFTVSATDSTGSSVVGPASQIVVIAVVTGVPSVYGLTQAAAIALLQTNGYNIVLVNPVNSVPVPYGMVAGQSPPAGSIVSNSTVQTLYVSIGPSVPQEFYIN